MHSNVDKGSSCGLRCSGDVVRVTGTLAAGSRSIKHSKYILGQIIVYVYLCKCVNIPFWLRHMLRRDVRPQLIWPWSAYALYGTESL